MRKKPPDKPPITVFHEKRVAPQEKRNPTDLAHLMDSACLSNKEYKVKFASVFSVLPL